MIKDINEIKKQLKNCLEIELPYPFEYDVQKRVPDVSKAKDILGFEATTELDTILDEVIPWVIKMVDSGDI